MLLFFFWGGYIHAQQETAFDKPNVRIINGDAELIMPWFSGDLVCLFGTGFSYEQTMSHCWSMDFGINYLARIDDQWGTSYETWWGFFVKPKISVEFGLSLPA